ncbi:MAG TPA: nuclear transport factor 2 family protein [Pyrinomonadaceae bacterium]|jgi:ketosteroid isomerase-like protein
MRRYAIAARKVRHSEDHVSARAEIEELYGKTAEAVKNKDVDSIVSFLADDAMSEGLTGQVYNRQEWAADMKRDFSKVKHFDRAEYKLEKLTLKGDQAIVYVIEHFSGTLSDTADYPSKPFVTTMLARDVLHRAHGGWKVKHSETISDDIKAGDHHAVSSLHTL